MAYLSNYSIILATYSIIIRILQYKLKDMMLNCLNCNADVYHLITIKSEDKGIKCDRCGHEMAVELIDYDEDSRYVLRELNDKNVTVNIDQLSADASVTQEYSVEQIIDIKKQFIDVLTKQ